MLLLSFADELIKFFQGNIQNLSVCQNQLFESVSTVLYMLQWFQLE